MTAPCPKCGQPLTVSPKNAQPITREPSPSIDQAPIVPPGSPVSAGAGPEINYTPLRTSSLKTNCARCGKEFRGDWDRHPSAIGIVCNICRNLVTSKDQSLQFTGYVAPIDVLKLDPVLDPVPKGPVEVEEVEKTWREKYMPDEAMLRRIAIGGAVAFALYTVWILISGEWVVGPAPEDAHRAAAIADASQIPELPAWALIAMKIMETCSGFASAFAGIYIFLTLSHRLPESTFLANAIRILPAAAIITALFFAASVLPVPFVGLLVTFVFVPAVVFVNFGLEAQDIINFPLGMALGGVLQFMSYLLIYWLIASIAL
jgi:hypothetical protein